MGWTLISKLSRTVLPRAVMPEAWVPSTTGWPFRSDAAVGTVAAHDEHAGRGIHRRDDAQRRAWPGERGRRDLPRHQGDVEPARLEQRHVLGAALGVARLDAQQRLLRVHHLGEGLAVERKAAARRRGAQNQGQDHRAHSTYAGMVTPASACRSPAPACPGAASASSPPWSWYRT